jgi:predicted transcriptional regulator of viral defense system
MAISITRLADTAQEQWGLITRRQAALLGVPPATVERLTGGALTRVAHGVYRVTATPEPELMTLRAAWLQLAPEIPAWERTLDQGVVSHRSAARVFGLGHLPADVHEFTVTSRRQSRRADVRIHRLPLVRTDVSMTKGMPVTRPSRIAADLIREHEDPAAVGQIIADALRAGFDPAAAFALSLSPFARSMGLRANKGIDLLEWILGLVGDPETRRWLAHARADLADQGARE